MNKYNGRQKINYINQLAEMNNEQLENECYSMIYQSSRCTNNLKADWHWMVDACYNEAVKRDPKASIYDKAYKKCYKDQCTIRA